MFVSADSSSRDSREERNELVAALIDSYACCAAGEQPRDDVDARGVAYSRHPATGAPGVHGDFVTAGSAPAPVAELRPLFPDAFDQLAETIPVVEATLRDASSIAFSVVDGRLRVLQVTVAERSPAASVRIAVDLFHEGLVTVSEALDRIPLAAGATLGAAVFAATYSNRLLRGESAAPGAATGEAVSESVRAESLAARGRPAVLVLDRPPDTPETWLGAVHAARGLVLAGVGLASPAAVVARRLGRPAVLLRAADDAGRPQPSLVARLLERSEGTLISVDGDTGLLSFGRLHTVRRAVDPRAAEVLAWCEEARRVPVLTAALPGFATIRSPSATGRRPRDGRRLVIDVEPGVLAETVQRALAEGASELALRLRDPLPETARSVPRGPWTAVVAEPRLTPAARLLAARIPLSA